MRSQTVTMDIWLHVAPLCHKGPLVPSGPTVSQGFPWFHVPQNVTGFSLFLHQPGANPSAGVKCLARSKGEHLEKWILPSQVTVTWDGALLSWRWLNTGLPVGGCKRQQPLSMELQQQRGQEKAGLKRLSPAQEISTEDFFLKADILEHSFIQTWATK